jgi:predicted RNase H-like nuclease (RuvC/YqgF family)
MVAPMASKGRQNDEISPMESALDIQAEVIEGSALWEILHDAYVESDHLITVLKEEHEDKANTSKWRIEELEDEVRDLGTRIRELEGQVNSWEND